jgi:hypothetical protein
MVADASPRLPHCECRYAAVGYRQSFFSRRASPISLISRLEARIASAMRRLNRRRASACLGAILSLLTVGMLAPASARAGCDHPNHSREVARLDPAHFESLSRLGAIPTAEESRRSLPDPRPCPGPSCSRRQELPSAPLAPDIFKLIRAEQGRLDVTDHPTPPDSTRVLTTWDLGRPSPRLLAGPFRPPRIVIF